MSKKRPTPRNRSRRIRVVREADLDRAIELDPDQADAIVDRGVTYLAMGRYEDALADFDRAIELDPTEDEFAAARTEICQLTGSSDTDDALPGNRGTKDT